MFANDLLPRLTLIFKAMQKIFCLLVFSLCSFLGSAQSNNPFDQRGKDVLNAANAILADIAAGKVKEVSQATINDYYKRLLPNYQPVTLDVFNKLMDLGQKTTTKDAIENFGLSAAAKNIVYKSFDGASTTSLVDEVNRSNLSTKEKEAVLTYLAINYHVAKFTAPGREKLSGKGPSALLVQPEMSFAPLNTAALTPQAALWGGLLAYMGFYMCGPWCAIAGGIVGLIIGSLPGSTTTISTNNHSHYNGGHYNGPNP